MRDALFLQKGMASLILVNYHNSLLHNDEYHDEVIRSYHDTYNFICSVRDGLADMAEYN